MNIRIISPAGAIDPAYIDNAAERLLSWGHQVSVAPHAKDRFGRFAGTTQARRQDLIQALTDPNLNAVLCSRGGYGLMQLLQPQDLSLKIYPTILGFSDITCLHSLSAFIGKPSLHCIMAKHIASLPAESQPLLSLRDILSHQPIRYALPTDSRSRAGHAVATLRGGNLAVLCGLQGTPLTLNTADCVLFLEDVGEPLYRIDRMLNQLRLAGVFSTIKGLIVGQFTDCTPDPLMNQTIEELILSYTADYDYPVVFNFPAGHVNHNLPLILNSEIQLSVDNQLTTITQHPL